MFTAEDRAEGPRVVLVNETAAKAFWPNADPIGKTITMGAGGFEKGAEVIGVVSDVRYSTIETASVPDAYISFNQFPQQARMRIFVRSRLDQATLAAAIRQEVRQLDSSLPLSEVKTMEERVGDAMWRTRVAAWLFSAFAGLALLLTAVGIFASCRKRCRSAYRRSVCAWRLVPKGVTCSASFSGARACSPALASRQASPSRSVRRGS